MNTNTIFFLISLVLLSSAFGKLKTSLKLNTFVKDTTNTTSVSAFCFLNDNGAVYNLNPAYNSTADYSQVSAINNNVTNNNMTTTNSLSLNVCHNPKTQCSNSTGMVTYTTQTGNVNQCVRLAGSDLVVSKWTILSDSIQNTTRIQIQLPPGDTCQTNNTMNYTTYLMIQCDPTAAGTTLANNAVSPSSCVNTILMKSVYACPLFNVYSFWNAIISNKYIVGVALIIFGIFFSFLGIKFIEVTEYIAGVLATWFVVCFLLFSYLQITYTSVSFWVIIVCTLLAGLLVGYFIAKVKVIPVVILGGFLGYLLGNFTYQFLLKYINSNPQVVYWITLIVCIAALAAVAWFFASHIMVLSTSFIGAYALIRGISLMAGGYPDERQVIDLIQNGETDQLKTMLNGTVYAYLISMLVVAVAGAVIQYKYFYESDEDKKARENLEKFEGSKGIPLNVSK